MSDPNSPDRVPLDRPPVPRFNPLPDLPDLPEMPRGSAPLPTPSIPIPAPPPPMSSLPAPRVVVDLPRPSPSVTIDAPPRPAPRGVTPPPKPIEPKPPAPTPAPQGRWVGEAITTLMRPTKSKATVVAAAGSLVAAAFVMQLVVGTSPPSTPPTARTVALKTDEKPAASDEHSDAKPAPSDADEASSPKGRPLFASDAGSERSGEWPDSTPLYRVPEPSTSRVKIQPAAFPLPDANVTLTGGQTPASPMVPTLPELPAAPAPIPPVVALPVVPAPVAPLVVPAPALPPLPSGVGLPALPAPVTAPPAGVFRKPEAVTLPKPPEPAVKVAEVPNPFEVPAVKPAPPEPIKPVAPVVAVPGFKIEPDPPASTAATRPLVPAPVAVPAFGGFEPEPRRIAPVPTPPVGEARTDYDVDLHPPQAGQTYEAVSKQHYNDAKYADALRAYNRNRDPGRDELQLPPVYVLRKLAPAGRTPAAANPIAPAGGETWAPPATLGGSKPAAGRSYIVPDDGLTFRDLAGTLLNDRAKYRRISDLNPTLDPNAKLRKGDKVAVP